MPDTRPIYVHSLPEYIPEGGAVLAGGIAVVIDILRATTLMIHALAAGARAILPCREIDEARQAAAGFPPGEAILAGERQGVPIPGFDLGNSPAACTPEVCRGKTIVMTTTNGAKAVLASLPAEELIVAGFVNLSATLRRLKASELPVHLVCAGTDGFISLEDSLFAGAVIAGFSAKHAGPANEDAAQARELWDVASQRAFQGESLAKLISEGRGGARLIELGYVEDINDAARTDKFDIVGNLVRDPIRITQG